MKPAGQMTLSLTGELEEFVRQQVRDGAYASSSEYVRDLIRERYLAERDKAVRLQRLDAAIASGIADAEVGRTEPMNEAFARLRSAIAASRKT